MLSTAPTGRSPISLQRLHRAGDLVLGRLAGVVHDDRRVGERGDLGAVGHRQQRRGVDDRVVDRARRASGSARGRARRSAARWGSAAPARRRGRRGCGRHSAARPRAATLPIRTVVKPTSGDEAERRGDGRPAQVGLDQADLAARLGQRRGEVERGRRLALAGHRAGDRDDARRVVDVDELQVRAQLPVGLGPVAVRVAAERDRDLRGALVEAGPWPAPARRARRSRPAPFTVLSSTSRDDDEREAEQQADHEARDRC